MEILRRSVGLSMFNETLTRCTLDDPRYVALLQRYRRWIDVDHLLPSDADLQSIASSSGYGGQSLQMFAAGRFAMIRQGRFAMITLRQFTKMPLACSEPPNGGFPNTLAGARLTTVYAGSKHTEQANLFLSFLAGDDYNEELIRDADGQPPNPSVGNDSRLLEPPQYPNEWRAQRAFARAMSTIAIAGVFSPFVLPNVATRIDGQQRLLYLNGVISADQCVRATADRINQEIDLPLVEIPALRARYEELQKRQHAIDDCRAKGVSIPAELIENPFYRRFYGAIGKAN